MNDEDYAYFWGLISGAVFTILGQKLLAKYDILGILTSLLRAAS